MLYGKVRAFGCWDRVRDEGSWIQLIDLQRKRGGRGTLRVSNRRTLLYHRISVSGMFELAKTAPSGRNGPNKSDAPFYDQKRQELALSIIYRGSAGGVQRELEMDWQSGVPNRSRLPRRAVTRCCVNETSA